MNPLKTRGLVLRTADSKNSSQVLTVLTPDLGKISIWARGVRSYKNPMHAGCALLCYSEFILLPRPGMYTLTGCSMLHSFYHLRCDVEKLSYAVYFAELAGIVAKEGIPSETLLKLLLNSLHFLEKDKKKPDDLKMLYELRLLADAGFMPHTESCVLCGNHEVSAFSPRDGGTVCADCAHGKPLSRAALSVLRGYLSRGLCAALRFDGSPYVAELAPLCEEFMRYQTEMQPKSLEYLTRMKNIF